MESDKVQSLGLEAHFKQLLKEWRLSQQKKHGERVEYRKEVNGHTIQDRE